MKDLGSAIEESENARQQGDPGQEALFCTRAGQLLAENNRYQEAAALYQQAVLLYQDSGSKSLQAKALNQLGACLVMARQPQHALESLSQAKKLLIKDPDLHLLAAVEGNQGLAWYALDDYTNAFRCHKRALELAEQLDDPRLQLKALINLAECNLQHQAYQPALGFALVAQDLALSLGADPALVNIYDVLGMIHSHQGDLQAALDYHRQAGLLAESLGDIQRQAVALANQALAWEALTDRDQAWELMSRARDLFVLANSDYQHKTSQDLERIQAGRA